MLVMAFERVEPAEPAIARSGEGSASLISMPSRARALAGRARCVITGTPPHSSGADKQMFGEE